MDVENLRALASYRSSNEPVPADRRLRMPTISTELLQRYGIALYMYAYDVGQHHLPHVHAEYAEFEAVVEIPTGRVLDGDLPSKKMRKVQAWIELHEDELMAQWAKAVRGETIEKVD